MTGNQSHSTQAVSLCLPEILSTEVKLGDQSWTVFYYQEYQDVFDFDSSSDLMQELSVLVGGDFKDFRLQLTVQSISLLAGIFHNERSIHFYSARLGREFFLVEQLEAHGEEEEVRKILATSEFSRFKEFTEKVAALPLKNFPSLYDITTHRYGLPDLLKDDRFHKLEVDVEKTINKLLVELNKYRPILFERFSDFGLNLTARYALLRIHLLKFLAILPSLDHDSSGHEVKRILLESLRRLILDSARAKRSRKKGQERALPKHYLIMFRVAHALGYVCPAGILSAIVRKSVRFMAKRFIAGETIETADDALKGLSVSGRDVTLDQLGELVVSEKEADHYMNEVIKLIRGFSLHVGKGEKNQAGVNRAHVSIKVSALCSDFKPYAFDYTYKHVAPRLSNILKEASEHDVFINIDAEHYDYRDIVFEVYKKVLLETPELKDYSATGIVLQAYLRDAYEHLQEIIELARTRGHIMPIRLVKGAYWDAETVEADAHAFNAPEFLNKEETDLNFRQMIVKIFEAHPHIQLCLASHNFADHSFAEALREKYYKHLPVIEHQCLHMTYEALSVGMARMGWVVRNYVPIGSLLVGMAYLVRRIMENSSQVGVLTMMRSHKKKRHMDSPMKVHMQKKLGGKLFRDKTQASLTSNFFNVAPARLYKTDELKWVTKTLESFKQNDLGKLYGNKFLLEGDLKTIVSSSDPSIKVGDINFGKKEDAIKAIELADRAYNRGDWSRAHWIIRASYLLKVADLMLAKRNHLASLIVYEAGKAIPEALADIDEAIDFLNFYARREARYQSHHPNTFSRGTIAVISPWNFPLAIPCGMVSAPLVAGNTVILKSAGQTPLIAQYMVDLFHQAGVPTDVLIHTPGPGSKVGQALVESERIAGIVFTGSKAVGMGIAKVAGERIYKNQLYDTKYPVKVITEMGGKNAIIVTANAELDETVAGILYSSFAHAGQKCSAASRVLVDNSVKDRLIERLKEACLDIEVSEAFKPSCAINPVITAGEKERLQREVAEAAEEAAANGGVVHIDRTKEDLPGYCVGPALIELPAIRSFEENSFARRELFGPIVHIMGFDDLDQALHLFNSTDYALTGGVFSQSQDDIDYVTARMQSGNIYVNRSITGARVAIEPFGGFKLSGTGPKAGGKSYLRSFHVNYARVKENRYGEEEGSGYEYDLCRPSGLTAAQRLERMDKGLDLVLHHFESLFQGIHGENKKILARYRKWLRKNFVAFQTKEHGNRKIPGQLSYNDFNIVGEHCLVPSVNGIPHFITFMRVVSAIMMGTGVTIATRNQQSYQWWSNIISFLRQAGFSKENVDCFISTDKHLTESLKHPLLSYVIVDGPIRWVHDIQKKLSDNEADLRMKALLTPYDAPALADFKRFLEEYAWVRAFAVNTMRHGAPLDLEF